MICWGALHFKIWYWLVVHKTATAASIDTLVTESSGTVTNTALGGKLSIKTTASGSASLVERITVDEEGKTTLVSVASTGTALAVTADHI